MSSCLSCGVRGARNHRFCAQCGAQLPAGGIDAATSTSNARSPSKVCVQEELKYVSALFVDVCDSTAHVRGMSPEGARAYLDEALGLMTDAVKTYGGTVSQLLGDGLVALFGAPVAHEDHALRACMAALAMQNAVRVRVPASDFPLMLRIGVHSGEVIVGLMGKYRWCQYRADGDTIHLASRLERLAPPGGILLSAATHRLVAEQVDTREIAPQRIRGFEGLTNVFQLIVATEGSAAAPLTRRLRWAPLVGRAETLGALESLAHSVRNGVMRVIGLRGEAGIGKSRLIAEWCVSPALRGFDVCITHARGHASFSAYSTIADLVRSLLCLPREDVANEQASAEHRLSHDWPSMGTNHQAAVRDLLEMGGMDGEWMSLNPAQRRRRTAEALQWLIGERLRHRPLLLVIEDIFLADRESQRLLEWLMPRLQDMPVLVCVSYRTEFEHRWVDVSWFVEHWLAPLREEDMATLARAMLGADASIDDMVGDLIDRADGNPFFLEQLVITLIDEGSLLGTPGAYHATRSRAELRVPGSIAAMIGARVDRLPPAAKAALEAAGVLSEPVTSILLSAMLRVDAEEMERLLRLGVAAGLLSASSIDAGVAANSISFRHALVQEVVVGALTRHRREALHRRALEALKEQQGVPDASALMRHAIAGAIWGEAATYAVKAMAKAVSRSANREALRLFDLGVDSARRVTRTDEAKSLELNLLLEAIGALMALGHIDAIFENLERADAIASELGDQRCRATVSLQMAVFLWMRGCYTQGLVRAAQALEAGRIAMRRKLEMAARQTRMMMLHGLGRYRESATEALFVLREFNSELRENRLLAGWATTPVINLHSFLASTMWRLGDYQEAQRACDCAYDALYAFDHPYSRGLVDFVQSQIWNELGRFDEAERLMRRSVESCAAHDVPTLLPCCVSMLGSALARGGKAREAANLLEQAFADRIFVAGGTYGEFFMRVNLGVAFRNLGQWKRAIECGTEAVRLAKEGEQYGHGVEAMFELGESFSCGGDESRARDWFKAASEQAKLCEMPVYQARCAQALEQRAEKVVP
ncbi:ATP-binding protein [Variovorax saccharolyticus]|uniref:ATP-binding protein n=1 Tax=Variovorax saccharolyticus TaxID=3053516 RepID=UPI002575EDA2|nr:adenylate/guanylate cyclase domain-containing protein [Variovorax sp. J22R187]MDM0022164.1 adenylate/guanylate cyclase domain-containing protein [Variovorax sp. J22R187]